ncbi:Replication factor C subunit 4, partial [Geodia barretti]
MDAFLKGSSSSKPKSQEKSKAAPKPQKSIPWVEKYRPRSVEDVAHQDEVVAVLKKSLQGSDLPNLLFYGPPGTGKTSAILAVAKQLFGWELYRSRVLELNASDERGIQVIREKVKGFSQQSVSAVRTDGKPCPPFKIVILDEADSMTSAAQAALRRTMERESKSTRFCLICNYISRIIEPLTSRCSKFRFKPLAVDILRERLQHIANKENVTCSDEVIDTIVETSEGDLRKAITYLQSAARLKGSEEIDKQDVLEIAAIVPESFIESVFKACHSDSYERLDASVKVRRGVHISYVSTG